MTELKIVSRAEWGARHPTSRKAITTPTPELWLHHTAGNSSGAAGMRGIQDFHMTVRGWSDIAYSFVIDPDTLTIYEGRGAGAAGAHTAGRNSISHAICVMGDFTKETPTPALIALIGALIAHGHNQGWWPAQITGGHQEAPGASTACPGSNLQATIPAINAAALDADYTPPKETPTVATTADLQHFANEHGPGALIAVDNDYGPATADKVWHTLHALKNKSADLAAMLNTANDERAAAVAKANERARTAKELGIRITELEAQLAGTTTGLTVDQQRKIRVGDATEQWIAAVNDAGGQ